MEKTYIAVVLAAIVLVVLELPSCEAGCRGGGGVQCVTNDDCSDGYICVNGACKPCFCRLPSECYADANGNVLCNCSVGFYEKYCNCIVCPECNSTNNCEMGWEYFDGHCYMIGPGVASHTDAMFNCGRYNGWSVEIQSLEEHNFLFKNLSFPEGLSRFVIGGAYDANDNDYMWVNSSTIVDDSLLWAPGAPGLIRGCMVYEKFGEAWLWIAMEYGSDCTEYQTLYVCEKEEPIAPI